jgi:7-cyano-7-deazaguanine reductase
MFNTNNDERTSSLGSAGCQPAGLGSLPRRGFRHCLKIACLKRCRQGPAPERSYHIRFETDDFTSVCPVTGQPDFARIDIDYVPDRLCVESKSLKFYLASYRNERAFNEAVTNHILGDFVKACAPREVIVTAQFSARGGIALTVRAEYPDKRVKRRR